MAHKGRGGPRTVHRELSLDAPLRFHAWEHLSFEIDLHIDLAWETLTTPFSAAAVYNEVAQGYTWRCEWNEFGEACSFQFSMGVDGLAPHNRWACRFDATGTLGGADWHLRPLQFNPDWFVGVVNHFPAPLDPPVFFGTRITAVGSMAIRGARWSDLPLP